MSRTKLKLKSCQTKGITSALYNVAVIYGTFSVWFYSFNLIMHESKFLNQVKVFNY